MNRSTQELGLAQGTRLLSRFERRIVERTTDLGKVKLLERLGCPLMAVALPAPEQQVRPAVRRVHDFRFNERFAAAANARSFRPVLRLLLLLLGHATHSTFSVQ